MTDNTALLQALQAIQQQLQQQSQQLQQQSQQLQQQSQQQIEQNTKILEALNIREQPKRDNSRYGSSSDEEEEGEHVDPANQQRNRMPRIKADIPTFSGSLNIEDFLDWVSETEKYFELMDIPEDSQVKYVAYKLRGAASSWWDNLQTGRRRQRKQPIRTWRKMKRVMFARFLPVDYEQTLYSLYQNCRQYSRTVSEYAEEFMRLASRNQLSESDAQQVARFNNGLRYDIQAIICLQTTWTLDEAVRMALKAEHTVSKGKNNSKFKSKPDLNQSLNESGEKTQPPSSKEGGTEKNKSTYASTSSQTTKKLTNPYARPVGNKCFKCQKIGHTSNQCRAKAVNVTERGELYEEESENEECFIRPEDVLDEEEDDEHEAYSYVVRRLMLTTPKKSKDTQRHKIFRTRCKINQDVVNVIIDGGSSENIISRDIVSRLKLAPRKHLTPYKIGWIKAVGEVRVTEQSEVLISMGKYKDTVLFDIVDMDCHVLLGRPWQFDLNVVHKGKENTYTFSKGGRKFTLCPYSDEVKATTTKEKKNRIMLCSTRNKDKNICVTTIPPDQVLNLIRNSWSSSFQEGENDGGPELGKRKKDDSRRNNLENKKI
ncbi:putative receptor protein kinase ZmPK1 [Tanacetum coccineum]